MNGIIKTKFYTLLLIWLIVTQGCEKEKKTALPVDGDGNEYDTVLIGTQVWLKTNLKTTTYTFGDPIALVPDYDKWGTFSRGAYCWYDNDEGLKDTYGALYNFKAVQIGSLCPTGWHVPTLEDWTTLVNYLGKDEAGDKLRETGTLHWQAPNDNATNESGWTALPGGWRSYTGDFRSLNLIGAWWVIDKTTFVIYSNTSETTFWHLPPEDGFSIRCIKDQ